jgi:hypothetical protein
LETAAVSGEVGAPGKFFVIRPFLRRRDERVLHSQQRPRLARADADSVNSIQFGVSSELGLVDPAGMAATFLVGYRDLPEVASDKLAAAKHRDIPPCRSIS